MGDANRERARASLEGLSVGDAFGERFVGPGVEVMPKILARIVPSAPWPWTDDTAMALSIVEVLTTHGRIDQDALALAFARRFRAAPDRGYGVGAFELLTAIAEGTPWRQVHRSLFRGMGSFGNGAAMRAAPLGAYFADDLPRLVHEAVLASEVTHAHREGIAGGVAVAVATALVWRDEGRGPAFLKDVAAHVAKGETRDGILEAAALPASASLVEAAVALGNGNGVTAPDTVPLCLWVVSKHAHYEEAMWTTVSALGDRDTTCAIVGGILAVGDVEIPSDWRAYREALDP